MFHRRWDDCIKALTRHLSLPTALWKDERSASMRYIAFSYMKKGDSQSARDWYLKSIAEAPHLREGYVDLAQLLYLEGQWYGVLYFTGCALDIKERPMSYICEAKAWGSMPHDLRSVAYYNVGDMKNALKHATAALELEPDNERIKNNVDIIRRALHSA